MQEYKRSSGFTLVELLVVISVIAVLAVIGMVIYSQVSKAAMDARKKTDIGAIASAYEIKYLSTGQYTALTGADFASGAVPVPPGGGSYDGIITTTATSFRICSALNSNPSPTCSEPSNTCYCRESQMEKFVPTVTPTPTSIPPTPTPTTAVAAKYVFVTSTSYTGDLGGLAGADSKCQLAANEANLGRTWKAWLSDSSISAGSRLTHSTSSYKLLNGTTVANNWTDLTDGSLGATILVNELGQNISASDVMTNTFTNGNVPQYNNSCNNWSSGQTNANRTVGHNAYTNSNWTYNKVMFCDALARLYCIEQ